MNKQDWLTQAQWVELMRKKPGGDRANARSRFQFMLANGSFVAMKRGVWGIKYRLRTDEAAPSP